MADLTILVVFPLLMIGAGIGDCLTYKIPNWLTGWIVIMFFPVALYAGMPIANIGWHLMAAGVVLVICFSLFCFGLFGGGDAKLLTAAGLWIGFGPLLPFVIVVALFGGVLAIVMKLWWIVKLQIDQTGVEQLSKRVGASIQLPYGIAIAAGAILVFPDSWLYTALGGPAVL